MKYTILLLTILLYSCQGTGGHEGHDHESHNEHEGHDHSAHEEHKNVPSIDYTIWTDKTELFVEFPALIVGKSSRFISHFTVLKDHQAVTKGSVVVSLMKDGKGGKKTMKAPSNPGIFTPIIKPKKAGVYQLIFDLKTPTYSDRIVVNDVRVYANEQEAVKALGEEKDDGSISFLKEQAWKVDFQTSPVIKKMIYEEVSTSGIWKTASSDYKSLIATTNGTVTFKKQNLIEGALVKKGQALLSISSNGLTANNLSTEIRTAKLELDQSKTILERKQKLYTSKIISKGDFDKANQSYQLAKTNYEALSSGYSSGSKIITAPFNGYIKTVSVNNGSFVDQGAELVTVSKQKSNVLEVQVSPSDVSVLSDIHNVWYQPKESVWSNLLINKGSVISVGKSVDKEHPLLSVFVQVNDIVEMPEGSFTEVRLAVGESKEGIVIDQNALLENYGAYSVVVQLSGESYEKRFIKIGKRNGTEVEVISGLKEGEVVVTKGAYQVKMASMTSQVPAHGHAH